MNSPTEPANKPESGEIRNTLGNGRMLALYDRTELVCIRAEEAPPFLGISMPDSVKGNIQTERPTPGILRIRLIQNDDDMLYGEREVMRFTDCMDESYPILARTAETSSESLTWRFTVPSDVQIYHYASCGPSHLSMSMLLFILPAGAQLGNFRALMQECRMYVSFSGETEWDSETGTLRISKNRCVMTVAAGAPQEVFRRSVAAIRRGLSEGGAVPFSASSEIWVRYYRKSAVLLANMRQHSPVVRAAEIVRTLLVSVFARRMKGMYFSDAISSEITVRELGKIAVFLGLLGYTGEVGNILALLNERFQRDGRLAEGILISGGNSGETGYFEYDTALATLRIFLLYADLTGQKTSLEPYLCMVSECYRLLRGALRHFMVPYSGHEAALRNRPFDVRFRGSARATMEYIVCMKRLHSLKEKGRLPLEKKLRYSAALTQRTEEMLRYNFVEAGMLLPDRAFRDVRKPSYVYGVCPFCLRDSQTKQYVGWLKQKATGLYACPACYLNRMPNGAGRSEFPPRREMHLPALLSCYWELSVLTKEELEEQMKKDFPASIEAPLSELSLAFYITARDHPNASHGNRFLPRLLAAFDRVLKNGDESFADMAFAAAMLVAVEKKNFHAY